MHASLGGRWFALRMAVVMLLHAHESPRRERRCGWFAALVVVVDPRRPLASVCACMGCSGIAPVPLLMVSVQEACLHA